MRNLSGTYVHRGEAARRRRRAKRVALVLGFMGAAWWVIASRQTATASAEPAFASAPSGFFSNSAARKLRQQLETTKGELTLVPGQYDRAQKVMRYSTRCAVPAGV